MAADYRVGSCYHCLVSIPVGSLLAWILVILATIGWGTSTWLGLSKGRDLVLFTRGEELLSYEEIAIIAICLATLFITVIYLIIATFSSQRMSRYAFSTSAKNTFGYCLSITVIIFSFISVLFWTAIIGLTMLPVSVLSMIHILYYMNVNCLHLKSYGVGVITSYMGMLDNGNVFNETMNTVMQENITATTSTDMLNISSVGVMSSVASDVTTTVSSITSNSELTCGDDLSNWIQMAWLVLVPLLISLAFAAAAESAMLGFMVAASSNSRHLRERMEYINEPYTYSSENVNGNSKSVNKDTSNPVNNNQTDTQI